MTLYGPEAISIDPGTTLGLIFLIPWDNFRISFLLNVDVLASGLKLNAMAMLCYAIKWVYPWRLWVGATSLKSPNCPRITGYNCIKVFKLVAGVFSILLGANREFRI